MKFALSLPVLASVLLTSSALAQSFSYPDFNSIAGLTLNVNQAPTDEGRAIGQIIHRAVFIESEIADLMKMNGNDLFIDRALEDAFAQNSIKHGGK